jgi:hypothetical protein
MMSTRDDTLEGIELQILDLPARKLVEFGNFAFMQREVFIMSDLRLPPGCK